MTTNAQLQIPPGLTKEAVAQSVQLLTDNLFQPVFMHRLSQYGIVPKTAEEQQQLLDLGEKLEEVAAHPAIQEQTKAASAQSPISLAAATMNSLYNDLGLSGSVQAQQDQALMQSLSKEAATQPDIANAVLTLRAGLELAQAGVELP